MAISGRQLRFRRRYPVIPPCTARLPRAQSALAMTHQGNALVHQRPPAIEWLCTRRSLSAATPHILAFTVLSLTCTDRQHSAGSGMPLPYNGVCDQRECLPEIATGAKRPRNDTSGSAKVHQRPCTVELPRTGRSGSAAAIRPASWCGRWSGRKFVSRARGNNEDLRRQENAVSAFP